MIFSGDKYQSLFNIVLTIFSFIKNKNHQNTSVLQHVVMSKSNKNYNKDSIQNISKTNYFNKRYT